MILNTYLVTTLISLIVLSVYNASISARLKRTGYKRIKEKGELTFRENLFKLIKIAFFLLTPILNICLSIIAIIKTEELYEKLFEEGLLKGEIIQISKEENKFTKTKTEQTTKPIEKTQNFNYGVKEDILKSYDDMSDREKLMILEEEAYSLRAKINEEQYDIENSESPYIKKFK